MIRGILLFLLLMALYQAARVLFRSAFRAYHRDEEDRRLPGREMVQDPQCLTYIVKERAVTRRINGMPVHFCSDACAEAYEQRRRP